MFCFAMLPISASATGSVTLAWNPSTSTNVVGYDINCGLASGDYTNTFYVDGANSTNTTITGLVEGATYYFAAVAVNAVGVASPFSNEISYSVPANAPPPAPVNAPPTLDPLSAVIINENAGLQTVNLTGISTGASNQVQTLTVTAVSSNQGLIPNPTVNYTSPNATGSLNFAPAANGNGSATITVTVNNNGASNNIVTQTFTVTVNPVNQQPTLNALANLTINENAASQAVNLNGISSGAANQVQTLTVTAVSSNPGLIPNPTVNYTSPNATGTLNFAPTVNGNGTATITVTVNNNGASNNIVTQTFTVTVNPVNQQPTLNALANLTINENAASQTVNLSGISSGAANQVQTLTVTAVSSNPGLIPNPTVNYTSLNATGTLNFAPTSNGNGTATITVTVNNNGASNNIVTQTFTVTVNPVNQQPTLNALANLTINENAASQTVNLGGISSGAANQVQTLTVTAVSSNPGLIPNPTVNYTNPGSTGTLSFTPTAKNYGATTITVTVNNHGASNNIVTQSFTVTVNPVNQPPTLNALTNLTINWNTPLLTVNLSGISSGASNQVQTLTVTAVSSNTGLIPNPTVNYTNLSSTGTLVFTPTTNSYGTTTITVTVNNNGASNNIVTRSFTITVNLVNQPPTLNPLNSLVVVQSGGGGSGAGGSGGKQSVSLTGISSGLTNKSQSISITATSSSTLLIPTPTIGYTFPMTNGTLSFTPSTKYTGTAIISVTINNGLKSNNIITRSFTVTTLPSGSTAPKITSQPTNLVALAGQTVTFSVAATGTAPLKYQWLCNSNILPSATNAVLKLTGVAANQTGQYRVTVSNILGVTNTAAALTVYSNVAPALASATAPLKGQFAVTVNGVTGYKYVVQVSTNMVNWTSVQTNTPPFTFVDTNAGQFKQRFYRSYYLQ